MRSLEQTLARALHDIAALVAAEIVEERAGRSCYSSLRFCLERISQRIAEAEAPECESQPLYQKAPPATWPA